MREIRRYAIVDVHDCMQGHEYDTFGEAWNAATASGEPMAVVMRCYTCTYTEMVETTTGSRSWPPTPAPNTATPPSFPNDQAPSG